MQFNSFKISKLKSKLFDFKIELSEALKIKLVTSEEAGNYHIIYKKDENFVNSSMGFQVG